MKKQLKTLINKVELFEKLAVYGDRGTFLKALAKDELDPTTKLVLQEIASLLQQAGITDEEVWNPLNNALVFSNVDMSAIRQAVTKASFRNPSIAHFPLINKLFQLVQQLGTTSSPAASNVELTPPVPAPEEKEVSEKPTFSYPQINKEEQRALGKILTIEGLGLPLDADGLYGPKTKAALQAFKKKFNLSSWTDAQALTWAKMLAETEKYK